VTYNCHAERMKREAKRTRPRKEENPIFSPFCRGEQSEARRENNGEDYREREGE